MRQKQIVQLGIAVVLGAIATTLLFRSDVVALSFADGKETTYSKDLNNVLPSLPIVASVGSAPANTGEPLVGSNYRNDEEKIRLAWSAPTGLEAWSLLKNSDFGETGVRTVLGEVRDTCRSALNPYAGKAENDSNLAFKKHAEASALFLSNYCGDAPTLIRTIDAVLAPYEADLRRRVLDAINRGVEFVPRLSKREHDLEQLIIASRTSEKAADALINEIFVSTNPISAQGLGSSLAGASMDNGSLNAWNDYLPPNLSIPDRFLVFKIAVDLNVCRRLAGCGVNTVLTFAACANAGARCQVSEDLLSYRRRTTSPMLYQAAEQIAAAMQARRYR